MKCSDCLRIFEKVGEAFNAPIDTDELLQLVARTMVEQLQVKGCHILLLSRDLKLLETVASYGLSRKFLDKGPVDAERSVAEALGGKAVLVSDCATDPRIQYQAAFRDEGIASLLTVPLTARTQVIGVLRLSMAEHRELTEQEMEIVRVVASFSTSAILHSMFHSILEHVTETIRSSLDLDAILKAVTRVVSEDLRAKGCCIQLAEPGGALRLRAFYGLGERFAAAASARTGQGLLNALQGSCVQVLDARSDPRVEGGEEMAREGVGSILYVPLATRKGGLGVLTVYTHHPYEFSEDELYLMTAIGEQCALAIRNAQVYAAVKHQYEDLVEDFHRWFEFNAYSPGGTRPL